MTSLRKQKNIICKATAALLWLALWAAAAALVGRDLLLPGPLTVLRALAKMACEVSFWKSCAATLGRIMAGFALGLFLGCALGALSWTQHQMADKITDFRAEAAQAEYENGLLERNIQELGSAQGVERTAQEELGMVPRDTVLIEAQVK